MKKQTDKKNTEGIDESYLMDLISQGRTTVPAISPKEETEQVEDDGSSQKSTPRRPEKKGRNTSGYGEKFLRQNDMNRRGEKSIYIRPEYHERLSRIVQVVGEDAIPLYAYLDNILEEHFSRFEAEILEEFNRKTKPLF